MLSGALLRTSRRCGGPWRRALATQRFPVPSMGDSITEGTLLELHKKVGDHVALEELVAMVETDKVTVEVRSPAEGTVTQFLAGIDDTVIVGSDFMEIDVGVGQPGAAASPTAAATATEAPASSAPASGSGAGAPAGVRVHPSGKPALISFPPRGAAALSAAAAPAQAATAGAAAAQPIQKPSITPPKPSPAGTISYADLPARFRPQPLSMEEQECVEMGGAGYTF